MNQASGSGKPFLSKAEIANLVARVEAAGLSLTVQTPPTPVWVNGDATRLDLQSERFGVEPEITCKVSRMGARIYEVPISYSGRTYAEGKKISWKDGAAALWHIARFNLVRPRGGSAA